jgi:uncharacterized protein (DUF58 family)
VTLDIDFARLARWNHILIPSTKAGRDRFRSSLVGRGIGPIVWLYGALSEEGRVLAVASVVVGAFGVDVQSTMVFLLWAALAALISASLMMTRLYRLDAVRVEVSAPRRVTLGDSIHFTILVHNDGAEERSAVRVGGPFLPWDGRWTSPAPRIARLPAGATERIDRSARFVSRGEHHLDAFTASALVPIGLAQGRAVISSGCKFLVVPRLASVVRLRTPPGSRYQLGGVAMASKTGQALDLRGVRPYRAGDPVRHLHARSWARAGIPVVREYQEEYFSRIGVVVESAVPEARKLEAMLSLAAGVVAFLSRGEALIDLLVVGDRVHELTIGRSLGFLDQALDLLACVESERARPEPEALVARLGEHLGRLSCVIVVAAAWDGGRLAERIRGSGVGCVTLVVALGDTADAVRGDDVHVVTARAIERGESISL